MDNTKHVTYLAWDSQFFGFNIGRISSPELDPGRWAAAEKESQDLRLSCLYYLADPAAPAAIQTAEQVGFHYMDARLTLRFSQLNKACAITQIELPNHRLRTAQTSDLPELKAIARESHHNSRFYADPNFRLEDCNRLYEVWIENSLAGYAQKVFVAENKKSGTVEAYITCHLNDQKGEIGLIAVDALARGMRIGYSLVLKSINWFRENGAESIEVVTQGGSQPAINLYQKAGFQMSNLQLWFHKWFYLPEGGKPTSTE